MEYRAGPILVKTLNARQLRGHGSIFGNVDEGGDIVVPGAFKLSLAKHQSQGTWPVMLWMHQGDQVAGRWDEIDEDADGLAVEGEFVKTPLGNEVRELLKFKAVRGLSIGYWPEIVDFNDDGHRLLKQVDLGEVSIVSMAMNPLAQVEQVKARLSKSGEYVPTPRRFERSLRDAGYSKSVATAITGKVFATSTREVHDDEEKAAIADILETCDRYVDDELVADIQAITRL